MAVTEGKEEDNGKDESVVESVVTEAAALMASDF